MSDRSQHSGSKASGKLEHLQARLQEAEETLAAIRTGDVDALVVTGPRGEQGYSLTGAEHVYRVIVETMNEAALTVDPDGTILFCNRRFCELMKTPIQGAMGPKLTAFVAQPQQAPVWTLLADVQAGTVRRHLTLRATDGAAVPVQLSASRLEAGDSPSICLVASDLAELEASAKSIRVFRQHRRALEANEHRYRAEQTPYEAEYRVVWPDGGVHWLADRGADSTRRNSKTPMASACGPSASVSSCWVGG